MIIICCKHIPALTPFAVRYELSVTDVNAILHTDGLLAGRKMVLPARVERERREIAASVSAIRAKPATIDIDELMLLHG